jgi:hypothetical protein
MDWPSETRLPTSSPAMCWRRARKQNMARIDGKELPELMRHIDAYQGAPITRLAMRLMALTFRPHNRTDRRTVGGIRS